MTKPVILTGLRANNDFHIGNYLGALMAMADMANSKAGEYQVIIMVADLHSFITPIDHGQLQEQIKQNLMSYVAAGLPLDNADVHIFRQSRVPAHSELTWILDCFTGFGEMGRMTEFKDKAAKLGDQRVNVGLFNYPVLMATDILLYNTSYVPVGDDQTQHLEYTRNIAERMNAKFAQELFVVPHEVKKQHEFFGKDQGLRIKDLVNPDKKMSKSDESGKGIVFLRDEPEAARQKILGAATDSLSEVAYGSKVRPGVSNLLDMLKLLGGNPDEFLGQKQYGPLKEAVADKVAGFLTDFQRKLDQVDEQALMRKLETSELYLNDVANKTLHKVQRAVGLR